MNTGGADLDDAERLAARVLELLRREGIECGMVDHRPIRDDPGIVLVAIAAGLPAPPLRLGSTLVHLASQTVVRGGRRRGLSRREAALLRLLVRNRGRTVTTEHVLDGVWGRRDRLGALYATVRRLRLKVEPEPDHPRFVLTDRGVGLRLAAPVNSDEPRGPSIDVRTSALGMTLGS